MLVCVDVRCVVNCCHVSSVSQPTGLHAGFNDLSNCCDSASCIQNQCWNIPTCFSSAVSMTRRFGQYASCNHVESFDAISCWRSCFQGFLFVVAIVLCPEFFGAVLVCLERLLFCRLLAMAACLPLQHNLSSVICDCGLLVELQFLYMPF